jgi:hypothetical protein
MANRTSPHILGTATNLLGFCLFVITSQHIARVSAESIIDETTSLIALVLIICCLFSFFSIRTSDVQREKRLENIADYLFAFALVGILVIILFIGFGYIK